MDVARPYSAVSPTLDSDVLVVLARTTRPLTGREVTRLASRGTQPAIAAALDRLVHQGLVAREQTGRAYLHTLNREHVAAPAVESLAALRTELLRRLREALAGWETPPTHVSMFGSAARGDGDADSDIDLFIVRPEEVDEDDDRWRAQLSALAEQMFAWTGNHAGIVELGEADVVGLVSSRPRVLADLRADGIDLAGTPLRELLAGGR